jgi:hypothetical protein
MYVQQLAFNWTQNSTTEKTRASVKIKIDSFIEGGLQHASEILSALLEIASKDEGITAPDNRPVVS